MIHYDIDTLRMLAAIDHEARVHDADSERLVRGEDRRRHRPHVPHHVQRPHLHLHRPRLGF